MLIAMSLLASTHGEGPARELRTLIGIEDVRLAVTSPRVSSSVATQNDASIAIDNRHDSTRRLAHAIRLIEQGLCAPGITLVAIASNEKTPNGVFSDSQRAA